MDGVEPRGFGGIEVSQRRSAPAGDPAGEFEVNNGANILLLSRAHNRNAGFYFAHPGFGQRSRYFNFLVPGKDCARHLLAIAQCGINEVVRFHARSKCNRCASEVLQELVGFKLLIVRC